MNMNEQDIMNKINEKTKDLPIPDSISPEAMKKMLDASTQTSSKTSNAGMTNKWIRRCSVAACIVIALSGAIGISKLQTSKNMTTNETVSDSAAFDAGSAGMAIDKSDEAFDDSKNAMESAKEETIVEQTDFQTPSSYEDYFHTAKDLIAQNNTRDLEYRTNGTVDYDVIEDVAMEEADVDFSPSAPTSDAATDMKAPTQNNAADKGNSYSKTNVQEQNIDEGDIIKTDGTYIYRVTLENNNLTGNKDYHLTITQTNQGIMKQVASINLSDLQKDPGLSYLDFHEFYLRENKLMVLYTLYDYSGLTDKTYCYISMYDLSSKQNPKLIKTLSQSGEYDSSRISDGYLYTISTYSDGDFSNASCYEDYIPMVNDTTIPCEKIYYSDDFMMNTSHVVTAVDLSHPTQFTDSISVPVANSDIYVSDNAIYFYAPLYKKEVQTEILKMYYHKGNLTPGRSAIISGSLYGPFAINEYNQYLRIVATTNERRLRSFSSRRTAEEQNALYVLDDKMNLTGKIAGIARGEIIYSARFMGDTGYFVTYKNTDPLFSVDLSDPYHPQIIGSLKIPGFSTYLHPYGENKLLGFGEETDPETGMFLGLKLSMFDISDPANVIEEDKYVIENAWGSTALQNYKDMMIDPEQNIFGFSYNSDYTNDNPCSIFATFSYDETYGFVETAKYRFEQYYDFDILRLRGLYIGDYLYLSRGNEIMSYRLYSNEQIDKIDLK